MSMSILLVSVAAMSGFEVTPLLGDNAVLQQRAPIPVWGTGEPGDTLSIRLEGDGIVADEVTVAPDGTWMVQLPSRFASRTPLTLTVSDGSDTKTAGNIVVGELWLASGQSNMEWRVSQTDDRDAGDEAFTNADIREFKVPHAHDEQRQASVDGQWKVSTPQHTPHFSGVAWNFARMLHDTLDVPVGIVNSSWGGSSVEAWMDRDLLDVMRQDDPLVARTVDDWFTAQAKADVDAAALLGPEHDDAAWSETVLPGDWASMGLGDVDGTVLYRLSIWVPDSWSGQDLTLQLGPIDDLDETFWDGVEIGRTRGHTTPRSYTVPAALVTPGRHVIGVRATDMAGAGGFFGKRGDMRLHRADDDAHKIGLAGPWRWKQTSGWAKPARNTPTVLNNAMIAPLEHLPVAGVIWYQGESNAHDPEAYDVLFPAMILDWRARFGHDMPFFFVQLANLDHRRHDWHWPQLREAQRRALDVDGTGMALCFDVGDPRDIHPTDKRTVGRRLARHALRDVYHRDIVPQGPVPVSFGVLDNGTIAVKFETYGGSLKTRDGGPVALLEVAGADGEFHPATARLLDDRLVASSAAVDTPVRVRYGWRQDPAAANLIGADDLPVTPFILPSTVDRPAEGAEP